MILNDDARKTAALAITAGGGVAMTLLVTFVMSHLRTNPDYMFWLGMAGMVQILVIFTGLLGLLVKRSIKISRSEVSIADSNL